jgi:polyisoprenoid-binding protein YceI
VYKFERATMKFLRMAAILWIGPFLSTEGIAQQTSFEIVDPLGRNVVMFESKAPMETIIGTTNKVAGEVVLDPRNLAGSSKVDIRVYLKQLDTGIERRNQDMRDQYLQTDRFPETRFRLLKIRSVLPGKLVDGKPVEIEATGMIDLHGVSREETVNLKATYLKASEQTRFRLPGNLLRIQGSFDLDLENYDIPIPKLVVMRLDNKITITLDVFATDAPDKALSAQDPCNPCGSNPCNPCNPCKTNPCDK